MATSRLLPVERRLRPIRFAFLVKPDERSALRSVIEVNTCLWGGRYNGIIPVVDAVPGAAPDSPLPPLSPEEHLRGYFDCFEPDIVVECGTARVPEGSQARWRRVSLDVFLQGAGREVGSPGLSVLPLYAHLFRRHFQFERREKIVVRAPTPPTEDLALFSTACVGAFPDAAERAVYREQFLRIFSPETPVLAATDLVETVEAHHTPLILGSEALQVLPRRSFGDPSLFVLDPSSALDVIDYWNLRALGRLVIPLPIPWADALMPSVQDFVQRHHTPYREDQPENQRSTCVVPSRTAPSEAQNTIISRLFTACGRALFPGGRYPLIWSRQGRRDDWAQRPEVTAREERVEVPVEGGRISFDLLHPRVDAHLPFSSEPQWANIVRPWSMSADRNAPFYIPEDTPDPRTLLQSMKLDRLSVNSEGVVVLSDYPGEGDSWMLPEPFDVFKAWFAGRGCDVRPTRDAHIARRIHWALRRHGGLGLLAGKEILELLEQMATGSVAHDTEQADAPMPHNAVPRKRWWKTLVASHRCSKDRADRLLQAMTEAGVLRVGLTIRCLTCNSPEWFPYERLTKKLRCSQCLSRLRFPEDKPDEDARWHYRTNGVFSLPEHATGAYSVLLTKRFLVESLHTEAVWIPGFEIKNAAGLDKQVDLALWWQRFRSGRDKPLLVLAECKSFGGFEEVDFQRAEELMTTFPEAVFVFATLKSDLTAPEKERIAGIVEAARERLFSPETCPAVVVLTARELFGEPFPPRCWLSMGGEAEKTAKHYWRDEGLMGLSNVTLSIHAGIDTHGVWLARRLDRLEQETRASRVSSPTGSQ